MSPLGPAALARVARAAPAAALALVVAAAPAVASQAPARAPAVRVTGRVVADDGGGPIAGVTVRVEGLRGAVETGPDGRFALDVSADGPVTLIVEGPVIETLRRDVDRAALHRPLTLTVAFLSWEPAPITVRAARPAAGTATTAHVTQRDLAAAPRRTSEDALRLVPGLVLVQHGSEGKGQQYFLRGFDAIHGEDLEVTLDGVPLNEWSNIHAQGYLDLAFLIPELVRDVEVVKGPFRLEQGAFALAGSASWRLGVPDEDRGWRLAYGAGTTNRHRLLVTWAPERGDTFVGAEALHDDGFGQRRQTRRASLMSRVVLLDTPAAGRLDLLLTGYLSAFDLPGILRDGDVQSGRLGFLDAYDDAWDGLSARSLALLRERWAGAGHAVTAQVWGSFRRLRLRENFTGFLVDAVHGDGREQREDAWSFGAAAAWDAPLHETLTLRSGLGARGDVLDESEDHVAPDGAAIERRRALDATQVLAHAFAGVVWRPVPALRVDAGARADLVHIDARDPSRGTAGGGTRAAVSPRVTAHWTVAPPLTLFAAYGRGLRPPEARAFTGFRAEREGVAEERAAGGGPEITTSDAVEVGLRYEPTPSLAIGLAGFATFIEKESVFDHVSGLNLELNATRRLGAELLLEAEPADGLTLAADLTYVDARFVDSGRTVPLAPWLTSGLRLVWTDPSGACAGLRALVVAPRPLPHGARGATFARLDATIGWHGRTVRLDLELENLLNRDLREGEYHFASHWDPAAEPSAVPVLHVVPGPPFTARLTLTVQL